MSTYEHELQNAGALLGPDTISENDYILGSDTLQAMFDRGSVRKEEPVEFYNQAAQRRTRNGCTLYMAMRMISDLTGHKFTLEEILEIHDLAEKKYRWKEHRGGYLYKAVDCLRNWWNSKPGNRKLISFRMSLDSDVCRKVRKAGKTIGIGYRTTAEHYKDSQDNGVIDKESIKGANILGGHAITHNGDYRNVGETNIDNYEGKKKFNAYKMDKLDGYVKDNIYFNEAYVFFYEEDSEFKDIPMNHPDYEIAKWAKDIGLLKGYDDGTMRLGDNITRGDMLRILRRASKM